MSLTMKVTNAGRAALVNASNTGTTPVIIAAIGLSETAVVPSATAISLPGEFKRIAGVAGDVVAADTIHVNVTDGGEDTYALRSFALYLGDGTLFAIYGQTDPFLEKTAQSIAAISIDAIFADIDAALLTFGDANFLNPPATTERAGVVELLTSVEAIAGADTERAATAKAIKDAVTAWLDARFGANNSAIWHPGNDGAGSGLDADLLDGKQAAAFVLGANYTAADILARLRTVDGAGSGMDSDLLDGQHGSFYTNIAARLGYTPANRAGDTFSGDIAVAKTSGGAAISAHRVGLVNARIVSQDDGNVVFYTDRGSGSVPIWGIASNSGPFGFNVPITILGATAWHAGNDGAGSGLDADLLHGTSGSLFLAMGRQMGGDITLARSGPSNDAFGGLELREAGFVGNSQSAETYAPGLNFHWGGRGAGRIYYDALNRFVFAAQGDITNQRRDIIVGNVHMTGNAFSNGNMLWHVGNDGAGSGLDADLLDGLHGSDFLRDIGSSQSTNGRLWLSNGMLLQWVNVSCSASGTSNFSWPVAFPNAVFAAVPGGRQGLGYSGSYSAYLSNISTAGGRAYGNNGGGSSSTVCIIAIGN
ncbi:gp53-like domain-containing protein [Aurantiacibacter suaedae]|uniref:gp53-like domain-containing protein n=1 Tax=Aurantiacibacter suaedae TaxID=2545755 RepID=UPI0010F7225F|nr:hypothetical protein [Aurantiacibacter suaedae]